MCKCSKINHHYWQHRNHWSPETSWLYIWKTACTRFYFWKIQRARWIRSKDLSSCVQYIWMTALLPASAATGLKHSTLREQILKNINIKQRIKQYWRMELSTSSVRILTYLIKLKQCFSPHLQRIKLWKFQRNLIIKSCFLLLCYFFKDKYSICVLHLLLLLFKKVLCLLNHFPDSCRNHHIDDIVGKRNHD